MMSVAMIDLRAVATKKQVSASSDISTSLSPRCLYRSLVPDTSRFYYIWACETAPRFYPLAAPLRITTTYCINLITCYYSLKLITHSPVTVATISNNTDR
jgi:hypothetical protein